MGAKIGWLGGGLGGFIWMPILAVVLICKGFYASAITGFVFFIAGIMCLSLLAPWNYKHTPLWKIYIIFPMLIIAGATGMLLFWRPEESFSGYKWTFLLPLLVIFIPVFTLGKKTWAQLHGE